MKSRKELLILALAVGLIVAFLVYASDFKKNLGSKYNQFITSSEGKALLVRCLFNFEGIDFPTFDYYLRFRSFPAVRRYQDLEYKYRIETALQFALKEFQNLQPEARQDFITTIKSPLGFKIGEVYYQEYATAESFDEKLAVIKVLLEHESRIWNK